MDLPDFSEDDEFEKSLSNDSENDDDLEGHRENPELADGMQSRGSKRDPDEDEEREGGCSPVEAEITSDHLNGHVTQEALDTLSGNLFVYSELY